MQFHIRKATDEDIPHIFECIKQLAEFEKATPEQFTNTIEQMSKEKNYFQAIVAVDNTSGRILGFALYFFAYFTWVGKSLYLDDIYVHQDVRGQGIGKALLKEIFQIAISEQCHRVRWQVLDWNTNAIELYKKIGMKISNEWLNCEVQKDAFEKVLELLKH